MLKFKSRLFSQYLKYRLCIFISGQFSYLEASSDIIHPGDDAGVIAGVVKQVPDEHVQRRQRQLRRVLPRPASLAFTRAMRSSDLGGLLSEAGGGGGHLAWRQGGGLRDIRG